MNEDKKKITQAMTIYFDGLYHSDVTRLAQVFHPKAIYVCATEKPLIYKSMEEYFSIVAMREAPASRNESRVDELASIGFAGPNTAFVKAHCRIGPRYFTDFLTFIDAEGSWQIISKVFHYEMKV